MGKPLEENPTPTTMQRLVVLLPVLNEALGLQWVLERVPHEALKAKGYETTVLVMDGHSTDQTEAVASSFGVLFIDQDEYGKGSAIRHGFRMAVELEADAVVMLDADGTYNPREMLSLLVGLNDENVVIGDRLNGDLAADAMTRTNYVGNRLLTWTASALYGSISRDVCSGYWAFSRGAIERLRLNSVSFEIEAEMFASMVHQRVPFRYQPISYRARLGEAKLGSTADGWKIFRKLITRRLFPTPLM